VGADPQARRPNNHRDTSCGAVSRRHTPRHARTPRCHRTPRISTLTCSALPSARAAMPEPAAVAAAAVAAAVAAAAAAAGPSSSDATTGCASRDAWGGPTMLARCATGRGRCVSIFLDKNSRYIGESQSKRPPKCRGRRHARTRLRSQPQPAARLLRRHPVRRHRLRRRRIPHALPPRRRPRPRAHGPVRIYQHACHLCRSPEGALGVCGVARETNITRHPRWLCGVA
jgi:hypothetical protein